MAGLLAVVRTLTEWVLLLGFCTPLGIGIGPPLSKLPGIKRIPAGEAAAWGGTIGLIIAIIAGLIFSPGLIE